MKISKQELESLRLKLEGYKQENGSIAVGQTDSLNCTCGGSCTYSCSSYCDGHGKSGGICWQNYQK